MEHTHDLTEGWYIYQYQEDVVIEGPGELEIALREFDARYLENADDIDASLPGDLQQRTWRYPIQGGVRSRDTELSLELVSTWMPSRIDAPVLHILHVGEHVTWHLSSSVGGRLQNWFAKQAEDLRG